MIRILCLTYISRASFCGTKANRADPDQTPQSAASDQALFSLHTEISFKFFNKNDKCHTKTLNVKMDSSNR